MRFLVRWAFRCLILGIVLAVALVLLKDVLLQSMAERRIRADTGMDVRMGKFSLSLGTSTLTIEDLKLYNTAEFGGSAFLDMPELHLELDTAALKQQKLRFKLARVNVRELNIVQSQDGRTNYLTVLDHLEKHGGKSRNLEFAGIDTLNLTLGKISHLSMKRPDKVTVFDLGLKHEIVTQIPSYRDLSGVVLKVALRRGITIFQNGSAAAPQIGPPKKPGGT